MLNAAYATNGRARISNGMGVLVAWSHSELSASCSITGAPCKGCRSSAALASEQCPPAPSLQVRDEG